MARSRGARLPRRTGYLASLLSSRGAEALTRTRRFALEGTINAGAGLDTVEGGSGSDEIHGGADADRLAGGPGSDDIFGDGGPLIVLTEGRKAPPDRRPRNRLSGLAAWLPSAGPK